MDPFQLNDNDIEYAGHPEEAPRPLIPQEVTTPPKDPYKVFKIIILGAVIVAIASLIISLVVIVVANMSVKKVEEKPKDEPTVAKISLTAKSTIERTSSTFSGKEKAKNFIATPIKYDDNPFYTVVSDLEKVESVAGFVASGESTQKRKEIVELLDSLQFNSRVFNEGEGSDYLAEFKRDDVICQLSVNTSLTEDEKVDMHWIELGCLDISVYKDYAEEQKTFYSTFQAATNKSGDHALLGNATIKDGALSGYKLAEIPISNVIEDRIVTPDNIALFYQTPGGTWRYFKERNRSVTLLCSDYNSSILKMAYADQPCAGTTRGIVIYSGKR